MKYLLSPDNILKQYCFIYLFSCYVVFFIYQKIYSETFWVPMMKRLWPMYFALPLEKRDVHVCSFEAIWSGNWAAAYFRYHRSVNLYV